MRTRLVAALTVAFALCTVARAQESSVRLYGFMDMLISSAFMDDNSLFQSLRLNDGARVSIDHLNLYIDARPGERVRVLSELSFRPKPIRTGARLGADIDLDIGGGLVMTIPIDAAQLPDRTYDDDPSKGEIFEWGSFSLERAWCEYQARDFLTIGFGKFITPAGIWNIDHGSPVLITVRQPYQTGLLQFFPRSQIGIMGSGKAFAGPVDLSYDLYLSSGRNGIDIAEARDIAGGGRLAAHLPLLGGLDIGVSGYTGMDKAPYKSRTITVHDTIVARFGIEAMFESGIFNPNDSTVQALVVSKVNDWLVKAGLDPVYHSYEFAYEYKSRETSIGADIKLAIQRLLLQMEFNYQLVDNYLTENATTTQIGFYALLSYGIPAGKTFKLTPYVMYEYIAARGSDNNPQMYLAGTNTGTGASIVDGFQTIIFGLNTKVASHITLKVEYAIIDVIMGGALEDMQDAMDASFLNVQLSASF